MPIQPFSSLHQIFNIDAWHKAEQMMSDNDAVILLQDAAYLIHQENLFKHLKPKVFSRQADIQARNIEVNSTSVVQVINDELWVTLAENATNTISW